MRARWAGRFSRGLRAAAFGYLLTALFAATVAVLAASNPGTPLPPRAGDMSRVALLGAEEEKPFAVAFQPAGPKPRWVLVACAGRVLRLSIGDEPPSDGAATAAKRRASPRARTDPAWRKLTKVSPARRSRLAGAYPRNSQPN